MKNFKKMMALVIAMVMCLSMALPAMAVDTTGAPTKGSITINSPVVSAVYNVYKVFDMTTNKDENAFSYTIDSENPFYADVVAYAADPTKGLVLTEITTETTQTYKKYNVQASTNENPITVGEGQTAVIYGNFDAQAFGQMLLAAMNRTENKVEPTPAKDPITATVETSDQIQFTQMDLGYYLINATYPTAEAKTVKMGTGAAQQTFEETDVVKDANGVATDLTAAADAKVEAYVNATVTTDYVNKYIEDHGITTNTDGSPLNQAGIDAITQSLKTTMTADAEKKILATFNNENGEESDINVKEPILVFLDSSKPDATINEKNELDKWDVPVNPEGQAPDGTPDHGEPEGGKNIVVADDGNGNAYYADWSEAKVGDSVHYQLRINAMNFIRTAADNAALNQENADTVQQVKEYILADFQSAHMHFDEEKGLHVSIWQGDDDNDSQTAAKRNVTSDYGVGTGTGIASATYEANGTVEGASYPSINYTNYAKDPTNNFFKNNTEADGTRAALNGDIFGTTKKGIVVPWVIVSEDATLKSQYPVYTITNVPKEDNGQPVYKTETVLKDSNNQTVPFKIQDPDHPDQWQDLPGVYVSEENHAVDAQGHVIDTNADGTLKKDTNGAYVLVKDTKPIYTYSIYNSDVTIVVDYWMILDKDAVVDEPGNKNFAQYGWNPVDNKDDNGNPTIPSIPDDDDEPSQKEEIDEATVYTYAIAWVKTDEKGVELPDATFELPFYVRKEKDGKSYVYAFKELPETFEEGDSADNYTNVVTTTIAADDGQKGVITIKGLTKGEYTIKETQAPAGYNKLAAPFTLEAKKSGVGVTTKTKTTIFLDANGNVTDTVTNVTKEYVTDEDTYNKATPAVEGEETSVPVYQFENIVNRQGSELPATGGMGTTLFYAIGAILVLGAGILLVSKRRMSAN